MGKNVVLTCFSKRFLVESHFFGQVAVWAGELRYPD